MRAMSGMRRLWLGASLLSLSVGVGSAQEPDGGVPPVREVVLSSAGLAEYTRVVEADRLIDGQERLSIPTRLADVDDALKSFLALGDGVQGVELRLPSSAVVADVFAGLPFQPEDVQSMDRLLSRLPGAQIVLRVLGEGEQEPRTITGRVMGVTTPDTCPEGEVCKAVVLVRTDAGGLERITLDDGVQVSLEDSSSLAAVDRGLEALSKDGSPNNRIIEATIRTTPESGPVFLSTVLAAPIWKTAYRASVGSEGSVVFQAWAVVENATQEDWEDVRLTLASGSPRTLHADLYARQYGARERVQTGAASGAGKMAFARALSADMVAEQAQPMPAPYGGMADLEVAQSGDDALVGARFTLPDPVSIKSGEVLSLPFLAGGLDSAAVAYANLATLSDGTAMVPLPMALDVRNPTDARLPAGVLTVYEEGVGFAGDTQVPVLEPGDTHTLVFSQDSGAKIAQSISTQHPIRGIATGEGVLRITMETITTRTVRVAAPEKEGVRAVLDYPKVGQESVRTVGAEGRGTRVNGGVEVLRFSHDVAAGETWTFETVSTVPESTQWVVGDIGDAQLLALASRAPDAQTRAWIERAVELRGAVFSAEQAIKDAQNRRDQMVSDQDRRRSMVESLASGTPAHDRFLGEILEAEDMIAALSAEKERQQAELTSARAAFADHVGGS